MRRYGISPLDLWTSAGFSYLRRVMFGNFSRCCRPSLSPSQPKYLSRYKFSTVFVRRWTTTSEIPTLNDPSSMQSARSAVKLHDIAWTSCIGIASNRRDGGCWNGGSGTAARCNGRQRRRWQGRHVRWWDDEVMGCRHVWSWSVGWWNPKGTTSSLVIG